MLCNVIKQNIFFSQGNVDLEFIYIRAKANAKAIVFSLTFVAAAVAVV